MCGEMITSSVIWSRFCTRPKTHLMLEFTTEHHTRKHTAPRTQLYTHQHKSNIIADIAVIEAAVLSELPTLRGSTNAST